MSDEVQAIDAVVNIWTPEALAGRPDRRAFYTGKMNVDPVLFEGESTDRPKRTEQSRLTARGRVL